jgi:hypothetical protein
MAFACQRAPLVRVTGELGRIELVAIEVGPSVDVDSEFGCAAAAVWHAVDLKTDAALHDVLLVALNDSNGLVADWAFRRSVTPPPGSGALPYARRVEAPAGWDQRVTWAAGPCQLRPSIVVRSETVDGAAKISGIAVKPGPYLGVGECPDLGVWHAVDMKFVSDPLSKLPVIRDPAN